ncbi:MAG TPA: nitroreductase family protein [Nitrospirota bacterium]|nr:nitroreductase family protein [Nitrospirota bacterium]
MDRTVTTVIDAAKCIGCGLCVKVCPYGTISMRDKKAVVSGDRSMSCGHCAAACPTGAIRVHAIDGESARFATFTADDMWLPHGEYDTAQLVRLMGSRRSCRNYTDRPVDRVLLDDLVKIGVTAPSGTNSQLWTFTILPTRKAVLKLGERFATFFEKLNRISENRYLRYFLKLIGKRELDKYFRDQHDSVEQALAEWENSRIDRLFHGATALIIVGSKPEASCPKEDALLATQNILLAAHSMGLGTCLIGYAVEAMKHDIEIRSFLGIPDDEKVYSVIALGYPDEKYQRTAGRKKYVQRYYEA